jgi:hypothetical protein
MSRAMNGPTCPIPPLVDGPDWVNGGTFCIRHKREPNLYWAATSYGTQSDNPNLFVSMHSRSKFRVRGVDLGDDDKETVLIRNDAVVVTLVTAHPTWSQSKFYVARDPSNNQLILSTEIRTQWKFGDFFTKFGSANEGRSESNLVVNEDLADEWEFC